MDDELLVLEKKLNKCQFCGNNDIVINMTYGLGHKLYYFALCVQCGANSSHKLSPEEAVESWNSIKTKGYNPKIIYCKDCAKQLRFDCPMCIIENKTLTFIEQRDDFFCGKAERK